MALAAQITLKPSGANKNNVLRIDRGQIRESHGFDLRFAGGPWESRRARGKALREQTSRESLAKWTPHSNRPDPLHLIATSNVGRQKDYIPLRMGRMTASPGLPW